MISRFPYQKRCKMKNLKNILTDYESVIRRLNNSKQHSTNHVIHMEEYCENPKQVVSVCSHRPTHLGSYHTHDFFEINYVYKGNCINLIEESTICLFDKWCFLILISCCYAAADMSFFFIYIKNFPYLFIKCGVFIF